VHRILLVEDDDAVRLEIAELFREFGYEVRERTDGQEALDYLRECPLPDLIVLDLRLPRMSGWEFRARQKREPAFANIPVLVMSADPSPQAEAVDAEYFLRKPFGGDELLSAVAEIVYDLERKRSRDMSLVPPELEEPSAESHAPAHRAVLLSGSRVWLRRLTDHLEGHGFGVEATLNAEEAVAAATRERPDLFVIQAEVETESLDALRQQAASLLPGVPFMTAIGTAQSGLEIRVDGQPPRGEMHVPLPAPAAVAQAAAMVVLRDNNKRLRHLNDELRSAASADELTGLFNRRILTMHLEHEVSRADRFGTDFCLLMMDLDGFKAINDQYGHAAGDRVLVAVGGLLRRSLRTVDVIARLGGDEFAILLPHTNAALGACIAERLRVSIDELPIALGESPELVNVGASFGCVGSPDVEGSADHALRQADLALYEAKRRGRNQVVVWSTARERA
jgi:two-component system, cell cycle response regulator